MFMICIGLSNSFTISRQLSPYILKELLLLFNERTSGVLFETRPSQRPSSGSSRIEWRCCWPKPTYHRNSIRSYAIGCLAKDTSPKKHAVNGPKHTCTCFQKLYYLICRLFNISELFQVLHPLEHQAHLNAVDRDQIFRRCRSFQKSLLRIYNFFLVLLPSLPIVFLPTFYTAMYVFVSSVHDTLRRASRGTHPSTGLKRWEP